VERRVQGRYRLFEGAGAVAEQGQLSRIHIVRRILHQKVEPLIRRA
jgi:hypothetical protein